MNWRKACLALLPALLSACAQYPQQAPTKAGLAPVAFSSLPGWNGQGAANALRAFVRGCRAIEIMPEDQKLGGSGLAARMGGQAGQWRPVCAVARAVPEGDAAAVRFFQAYFIPYQAPEATSLSGYFEPVYDASEVKLPGYDVPVYGRPGDLVSVAGSRFGDKSAAPMVGRLRYQKLVPYFSRAEIEDGSISGKAPVIAWLKNPVDAYMMQIQGAGRLRLPDGSTIELGFDGTNGRRYVPIGKLMVERGLLPPGDVSAPSISAWLKAHPEQARGIMDANPNYVFFKRIYDAPDDLGAPGALGVPLTPGISIAVAKAIPLGTPVYVATDAPAFDRLTVAQDIDASAHGFGGADIFFGIGRQAAAQAAAMKREGRLYVLLPRPIVYARSAAPQQNQDNKRPAP
ncbi:MAG TPA: murein transglycosylase A [Acetobacteraceae bacterium]|nr:murein transglycosylase A [Acetobacteraceae bacterium]